MWRASMRPLPANNGGQTARACVRDPARAPASAGRWRRRIRRAAGRAARSPPRSPRRAPAMPRGTAPEDADRVGVLPVVHDREQQVAVTAGGAPTRRSHHRPTEIVRCGGNDLGPVEQQRLHVGSESRQHPQRGAGAPADVADPADAVPVETVAAARPPASSRPLPSPRGRPAPPPEAQRRGTRRTRCPVAADIPLAGARDRTPRRLAARPPRTSRSSRTRPTRATNRVDHAGA